VKLRRLVPGDVPAWAELSRVCEETYLEWAPPGWTVPEPPPGWADRYLGDDAWGLLAFADADLVATVAFRREGPELAHVGSLLVHPAFWRRGIAGDMMDRAEAEMVARGYTREQLWTPEGAPAEVFYRARGWERDGRREFHPWAGLQMVGYARALP
jgi:GNAT superfamily N-acetyltransferase